MSLTNSLSATNKGTVATIASRYRCRMLVLSLVDHSLSQHLRLAPSHSSMVKSAPPYAEYLTKKVDEYKLKLDIMQVCVWYSHVTSSDRKLYSCSIDWQLYMRFPDFCSVCKCNDCYGKTQSVKKRCRARLIAMHSDIAQVAIKSKSEQDQLFRHFQTKLAHYEMLQKRYRVCLPLCEKIKTMQNAMMTTTTF